MSQKRNHWFQMRMSPDEKQLLYDAAEQAGYASLSDYIRHLIKVDMKKGA